ncbi:MAG: iron-containing alcohol dehydrogenase [Burkholderiales bacterium]|nr:iron-containing alcohol dehydrogenase [Burkholderiales bacterium]
MIPFTHWFPQQRVLFGRGMAADLRRALAEVGIARPLIVCSARAQTTRAVQALAESFGAAAARVWGGVQAHAPLHAAIEGAQLARAHRADAIVSFGGGSASDLAKGIALAVAEGSDIESFAMRREQGSITAAHSSAPKLPIVALPTTLSGAEVTPGFSLTRADAYKLIFRDAALAARAIVLDPELIVDAPTDILLGSGMNAIAHCVEALYSKARTPISSLFAEEGLRRLWHGLASRLEGADSADELLIGAYFAGAAIVNARTALHHAICHKLAPMARISHGEANAAVLPHVAAFNLAECPAETARMAAAMELPDASIAAIATRLHELARRAGLRTRLREFGLERDRLQELAARVFAEPGLAFNPRPIDRPEDIEALLAAAW